MTDQTVSATAEVAPAHPASPSLQIAVLAHNDTAINSSTSGPPPTGNAMNCLPPVM
jgi:hypothetical protein